MKLLCTPNSLYSRIIRIVAIEMDVKLAVEFVGVRENANTLLNYNPAGMVPTLVLEDGTVISESRLICEHIQAKSLPNILAEVGDTESRSLEGLVGGFIDGIAVWVREDRRNISEQSPGVLTLERARAERCLEYFNGKIRLLPKTINYSVISLICGLELMEMRVNHSWYLSYPVLASWYEKFKALPAFEATRPQTNPRHV